MTGLTFTLGQRWIEQYVSGMMLLHSLLGQEVAIKPKAPPTPETFVKVLGEIAAGTYDSSRYFEPGPPAQLVLITNPPPVDPKERYLMVGVNTETMRSQMMSVGTGGTAFEHPVWAIFAAHALSGKPPLAVPLATSNEDLWQRLDGLASAVRARRYKPEDFFGPIEGLYPPGAKLRFTLLTVPAEQIPPLRKRGMQALRVSVPPQFFELFQAPAK